MIVKVKVIKSCPPQFMDKVVFNAGGSAIAKMLKSRDLSLYSSDN